MAYLLQRPGAGLGEYDKTGNWFWEFYPPPYDFLAPRPAAKMPAPILGLGGCSCGGTGRCGGGCGHHHGLGLFESGLDWSQWGIPEWTVAIGGSYLVLSLMGDLFRVGRTVSRPVKGYVRKRRARAEKRAELQRVKQELALI